MATKQIWHYNISTVIVTFNRKELLIKCIEAVLGQSYMPKIIYVIDNASTDGTEELLQKKGLLNVHINGVNICYERLANNIGGAGGFYIGMRIAHENGCDAVWVMDDDGQPDKDCLKNLVPYLEKYDYISPMVIDIQDDSMMAFEGCTVFEFKKREENGKVKGCANPFNGILYSKRLIDTIGYPKKEMFIWGDEINYDLRAKTKGFQPVMIVNAIHRHPLNRQMSVRYFGKRTITISDKDWKSYCYIRNKTYNTRKYVGLFDCIKWMASSYIKFCCYYVFQCYHPSKMKLVTEAMYKGFRGDFSGLDKYLK